MLKLEKIRREINIGVRDKERVLNPVFLKALGIAIALHLAGIVLFQIHPFITTSNFILPPSLVESDIHFDVGDNSVLANFEKEGVFRDMLEPRASVLEIPAMPPSPVQKQLEYTFTQQTNPFFEIDEDWEHLITEGRFISISDPIHMHISGALAEIPLLNNGIHQEFPTSLMSQGSKPLKKDLVAFMVQVERATGRIFWYIQTQAANTSAINTMAEKILNGMRFEANSQHFVSAGEVEMTFTGKY